MGYYCCCDSGSINLKNEEDVQKIADMIVESKLFDEVDPDPSSLTIFISTVTDHSCEEDFFELYEAIEPFIIDAHIEWKDEENSFWLHSFDKDNGWLETPGEVTYDKTKGYKIAPEKERE